MPKLLVSNLQNLQNANFIDPKLNWFTVILFSDWKYLDSSYISRQTN